VTAFALDSSTVLTWVLQEQRWRSVDAMLQATGAEPLLPGPVLAEVINRARGKGNASAPAQIAAALKGQGMVVVHPEDADLIRCAELLERSVAHPGPAASAVGSRSRSILSLADGLILAIVERLGVPVVTRDRYWSDLAEQGHTRARVVTF
jgi:PIN domain nuclease of toxin-antitoxin system